MAAHHIKENLFVDLDGNIVEIVKGIIVTKWIIEKEKPLIKNKND